MDINDKFILDCCCGGRMFWFNKDHANCLYTDIRELQIGRLKKTPSFEIRPDKVMDFRDMDLPDKSFKLIVFDPPHLKSLDSNSWIATKYGTLNPKTWKKDILAGFNECWRVLEDYGVLIFKWSKSHDNRRRRDISIENLLKLLPVRPLFGHPSGSKINTIWFCFMKIPEIKVKNVPGATEHGAPCSPAGEHRQDKTEQKVRNATNCDTNKEDPQSKIK